MKEIFSFAGWSFVGHFASVMHTQGVNVLLNMFFGPIVNAARGIAVQVQMAVFQFCGNFQTVRRNKALSIGGGAVKRARGGAIHVARI